ncbi:MAG: S41 family peptidase [Candidatus Cloacimonadota bacterium]|nr:S41 family peptidase [Candidatus Cloacimonadota bacterium]
MISKQNKKILIIFIVIWIMVGISTFTLAAKNDGKAKNEKELLSQTAGFGNDRNSKGSNYYESLRIFGEVLSKINSNYVEEKDSQVLIDSAIEGLLEELDPHTTYFHPDDFNDFRTSTKGKFGGLGISISKQDDYITVIAPIEGTPAYRMGIMAGDKISKVDGESVKGVSTDKAIKKMRGPKGTKVIISIIRPGVDNELDFEITRDIIEIKSIPYAFRMDNGIGYIRISQFNANTTKELNENLDGLEEKGLNGLILDLRSNPGGLLNEAVDTLNEFLGPDKRVVFTKGKMRTANTEYVTKYNRQREDYPIIVLINEASASASEIVAGSIQDYDRGLVLGKTSFGKGSVQQLYPLTGGYGIKVTVAKYYIDSGRCIHKDVNDKLLKGEKVSEEEKADLKEQNDDKIYHTQKGREVHGGGGIKPDIEIKQDLLTDLGVEIRRKNLLFKYSIDFMTNHGDEISEDWRADDDEIAKFIEYAKEDSVEFTEATIDSTYSWMKRSVSSNIISRKFGRQAGYKISIVDDPQFNAAVEIFENYKSLDEMFEYAVKQKGKKDDK